MGSIGLGLGNLISYDFGRAKMFTCIWEESSEKAGYFFNDQQLYRQIYVCINTFADEALANWLSLIDLDFCAALKYSPKL